MDSLAIVTIGLVGGSASGSTTTIVGDTLRARTAPPLQLRVRVQVEE